jgi:putative hydrolase of the HAD superfamily
MFDLIALDADDTLWHNMDGYFAITKKYQRILSRFASPQKVEDVLNETEHRNIPYYGYGIKSFILSCMEAALSITNGRLTSKEMEKILDLGKEMVDAEIELLDHVPEVVRTLAGKYPLMLLTKGDLLDQERKLDRSGLASCFKYVEIVSNKKPEDYAIILERYNIVPERFLMVGNSLRSDILPVVAIGGQAVHISYETTWVHEVVHPEEAAVNHYHELESIQLLPTWLEEIGA